MQKEAVITIDGAAGTGKSTLGELLARRLGYVYFDTGVMYRAVTLMALRHNLVCDDAAAMGKLASQVQIDVVEPTSNDGRQYSVLVNGEDVTWAIRDADVERHVSLVSQHAGVRAELIRQQRVIAQRGGIVMVGRDIGTIVVPDALLKIFLRTSLAIRAQRRIADMRAKGADISLEQLQTDMARRDELDQHVIYPAEDALILQTDTISPAEGVEWIIAQFHTREQQQKQTLLK